MTILPIRIAGDPVLHRPTELVRLTDEGAAPPDVIVLLEDMYETLKASHGVGLAATQVGVGLRLFVYDCPDDTSGKRVSRKGEVINPVLETSDIPEGMPDEDEDEEGCLSAPGLRYPTGRAAWAKVTGVDRAGQPVEIEGTGLFARMLQHEVGHLDGKLYLDVLVGRWARKAKKAVKQEGWGVPGLSWTPGVDPDPFGH
ncbi:peptide deformylase [Segniliparus rugosus]|uniref:Peptide deformylase n=1 Tax=Segniliparus rugosus (strain ATCC BAA-974 / DSM 45345 / CCUG 50838 / CIP 108380 / JCM 13579 / CDC 945) TaxID=679197 RepID=E5XM00_SEGRC|nr:peptide deformylase [Segniliparus rugosus]EFV14606.1 peptide deformylase [Segniliparus rugosus ATCC BAA-974]